MKISSSWFLLGVLLLMSCRTNASPVDVDTDSATEVVADCGQLVEVGDALVAETEVEESQQPITQYLLVEMTEFGPRLRQDMGRALKGIGFNVTEYSEPECEEEMAEFTAVTASRQGANGTTTLKYTKGEDSMVIIDCASNQEVATFVGSMQKAGYQKDGEIYGHPSNEMGKIYVKVEGKRIKIIFPFEMLPADF